MKQDKIKVVNWHSLEETDYSLKFSTLDTVIKKALDLEFAIMLPYHFQSSKIVYVSKYGFKQR
jgi:hypothetical protein